MGSSHVAPSLQRANEAAEAVDTEELEVLRAVLAAPYDEQPRTPVKFSTPPASNTTQVGVHKLTGSS